MASEATSHAQPDDLPMSDLESTHVRLMALYRAALEHAEGVPNFVKRIDVQPSPDAAIDKRVGAIVHRAVLRPFTLGFLVRRFVAGHVSARVQRIRTLYQWREQELAESDPSRKWFAARQQELEPLTVSNASWSGLGAAARLLGGPVTAAVLVYLGGDNVWEALFDANLSQLGTLAFVVFVLVVYPSWPFSISFAYKRAVFLGGPEHPNTDEERVQSPDNIYAVEDALWAKLNAKKKPEPRLDRLCLTPMFFLWAIAEAVVAVTTSEPRGIFIFGACMFAAFGVLGVWYDSKRRYR